MRLQSALAAVALTVGGAILSGQQPPSRPPAQDVAASLQKKYDSIRDFTADFVQSYENRALRKKRTERGVVQVKKPGMMRWDYKAPEKKLFVSDGRRIYLWVPADNQVIQSVMPSDDQATTAVLFLVGKGSVTRDFTVSYVQGAPPDSYTLRLQPKHAERDYDWLEVTVDPRSYQIRVLKAADRQGGDSSFQFSNFKENTGLSDKTFEFKPPRGADVISGSPSR